MPHFVGDECGAAMGLLRQREHHHRPFHPGPFRRGVGDVYSGGELAGKDVALLLELMFRVGLIREDFTRPGINEQQRSAERFSPKRPRIPVAECPGFSEVPNGFVDLSAALLVGRDAMGHKSDSQKHA